MITILITISGSSTAAASRCASCHRGNPSRGERHQIPYHHIQKTIIIFNSQSSYLTDNHHIQYLVTQLDDLSPIYWDLCIDHLHLYLHLYISNIQRTQKYSASMYYIFNRQSSDSTDGIHVKVITSPSYQSLS